MPSARSYLYQVSRRRTAFAKPFVWWVKEDLDIAAMRAAAAAFVGFHDFQSFSDDDPAEKSTDRAASTSLDLHEDDDLILVHVEGSHFIWKMVRRLVGVLVEVGRGGVSVDQARAMLSDALGRCRRASPRRRRDCSSSASTTRVTRATSRSGRP